MKARGRRRKEPKGKVGRPLRKIIASRDLTIRFAEASCRAILKEEGPFRFDVGNPDGPLWSGFTFLRHNPSHEDSGSEYELISLRKGLIMSRRTLISLAASLVVGIACIATISTDAFAYRRGVGVGRAGVYHGGVHRGAVYRGGVYRGVAVRRGVAVGVGAAAAGAYYAPRCGYYPNPPCY